jgi:hypothetical protein
MSSNLFGYAPLPPANVALSQIPANQAMGIGQAMSIGQQAWGGLQAAQQGMANQYAAQSQQAAYGQSSPLPQFEENVPDDELEFEGKLSRWPYPGLYMNSIATAKHHTIACCQRMLML